MKTSFQANSGVFEILFCFINTHCPLIKNNHSCIKVSVYKQQQQQKSKEPLGSENSVILVSWAKRTDFLKDPEFLSLPVTHPRVTHWPKHHTEINSVTGGGGH